MFGGVLFLYVIFDGVLFLLCNFWWGYFPIQSKLVFMLRD
jgi:hypothetical protein